MASLTLVLSLVLTAGILMTVDGKCEITNPDFFQDCVLPVESESNVCSAIKVYISCIVDKVKDCDDTIKTAFYSAFDEKKLITQYCGGLLMNGDGKCEITGAGGIQGCVMPPVSQSNVCSAIKVYISCIVDKVKDCDDTIKTAFYSAFDEKKLITQYCGAVGLPLSAAVGLASSLGLSLVLCGVVYFPKTVT